MTVQQATQHLLFELYHIYDQREARNIADLVMENITEWKKIDRVLYKAVSLLPAKERLLEHYISALREHKPVQYVLHEAWFHGMKLYVDDNVLIPRPETEELVSWILADTRHSQPGIEMLRVLDIGTGSGCIPIALRKQLPFADVCACDVSQKALEVARKNALLHDVPIRLFQANFLDPRERKSLPVADILVSNPPYVPLQDKENMGQNVLRYEPPEALFVENEDPFLFYRAMADYLKSHHEGKCFLYVEIHERSAPEIIRLLAEKGFNNIELRKDLQERDRMIKAQYG